MIQASNPQEIQLRNDIQNLALSGLLFIPSAKKPTSAVVFIHGSGNSSRQNKWYLTIIHHLVDHGIAVLLPDKRGSEGSEGNWRKASFEDLATDAVAAVNYLLSRNDLSISRLGLLAISQGGWIAPIVALDTEKVSFIVDVVGTSVTAHEQLLYEERHNLQQMGIPRFISRLLAPLTTYFLRKVSQKDFWNAVGNFDPLPYWKKVDIPTMVLYGSEDTNVPSQESETRFNNLEKGNITVKMYEGSGHALKDPGQGDTYIRHDVLNAITDFIESNPGSS